MVPLDQLDSGFPTNNEVRASDREAFRESESTRSTADALDLAPDKERPPRIEGVFLIMVYTPVRG